MTVCPFCGAANQPDAEQCKYCKRSMTTRLCPHCGAQNSIHDTYCAHCFRQLVPSDETDQVLSSAKSIISPELPEGMSAVPKPDSDDEPDESTAPLLEPGDVQEQAPNPVEAIPQSGKSTETVSSPDAAVERIEGVLELNPSILEPDHSIHTSFRRATLRESELARLWQQISLRHAPMDEGRHDLSNNSDKKTSSRQRFVIFMLTFLLALVPILSGGEITNALSQPDLSTGPLAMELATAPTDQPLLVAFDYEPPFAGELDPVVNAALGTLLERDVPILTMTTRAASADMAPIAISRVGSPGTERLWTDLGYVPAQTGLRLIAGSWHQAFPLTISPADTENGSEVSRVLVFSDSLETSLSWIEIFGPQVDVPIQMVVTERIYPLLLPYQESDQLDLLISGISTTTKAMPDGKHITASQTLFVGVMLLAVWATIKSPSHARDGGN